MKKLILAVAACVAVWGMAEAIDLAGTDLAVSGLSENAAYTNSSDDLATLTVTLAANDTFEGTISGNIRLVVDGEPVAPGVYRKGDDGFGAYVEGEGAVQVGPSGVLLLVR